MTNQSVAIDRTCVHLGRLERTYQPNAFEMGGDLNARNPA